MNAVGLKLVLIFVVDAIQAVTQHATFVTGTGCQLSARIVQGCSTDVSPSRGLVDCLARCSLNSSCVGASWLDEKRCFHHQVCDPDIPCRESDPGLVIWSRGGGVDVGTQAVDCPTGCTGPRCDRCPRDCEDLSAAGFEYGSYRTLLDPEQDGRDLIPVKCEIFHGYNRIVVLSINGYPALNRTWQEYRDGFYQNAALNWVGLKHLHAITASGYTSLAITLSVSDTDRFTIFRDYKDFAVQDESQKYAFSFSTSSMFITGNVTGKDVGEPGIDCLGPVQHTAFSTWDEDNDGDAGRNCAAQMGPGWWGSGCGSPCNLFGTGFLDWDATPPQKRWSWPHLDMDSLKTMDLFFFVFLTRP